MAHYAKVLNNLVETVIVAEQDFIDILPDKEYWIKTSYNTYGGIHHDPITRLPSEDQTKALRYNYAGIGYHYDPIADAFYAPDPSNEELTFELDINTYTWVIPK